MKFWQFVAHLLYWPMHKRVMTVPNRKFKTKIVKQHKNSWAIMRMNNLPLIPNVGPCEGWRMQAIAFNLRWAPSAWHKPTVVVLLPSPSGVGVMLKRDRRKLPDIKFYTIKQIKRWLNIITKTSNCCVEHQRILILVSEWLSIKCVEPEMAIPSSRTVIGVNQNSQAGS